MIRFACPGCNATYTVGDDRAGKITKCPKCQTKFQIPEPEPTSGGVPPPLPRPSVAPPPLPASDDPVEVAPCPKCATRLSVMPGDIGLDVECPTCQTVFRAVRPDDAPAFPPAPPPAPPKRTSLESTDDTGRPLSRRRRDEDEDEDERPSRRSRRRDDDDEDEDERPSRKRRRRDDDDDDEDDRPRKRRRSRGRGRMEPHRGGTILALGIFGCLCCGIAAFAAVIMGMQDLSKMSSGQMDSDGRSQTTIGVVFGVLGVIVWILNIVLKVSGALD